MKLTLVRHAEVQEEYIGKYNGHINISLSEQGKLQAQRVAKELAHENFDKVYCSDLKRAKETLAPFTLSSEIIFMKELREKSWGIHEGKSFDEITSTGIPYHDFEQWIEELDGEKVADFRERIRNIFYDTILNSQSKNILVLTHGGVIKMFLSICHGISHEEAFSKRLAYAEYLNLEFL